MLATRRKFPKSIGPSVCRSIYRIQALLASPDETASGGGGGGVGGSKTAGAYEDGPSFDVASITPPETGRPVTVPGRYSVLL